MKKLCAAFIGLFLFSSTAFADLNTVVPDPKCNTEPSGLVWIMISEKKVHSGEINTRIDVCGVDRWSVPSIEELRLIFKNNPDLPDNNYWVKYILMRKQRTYGQGGMGRDGKLIKDSYVNSLILVGKAIGKK